MFNNLFDMALSYNQISVTLTKRTSQGVVKHKIVASPDNYARKLEGVSNTIEQGRSYVISSTECFRAGVTPKRGDMLETEHGNRIIDEVNEMIYSGAFVGYRVRTQ